LQSGVLTTDEVLHAQQSPDVREGHQCWLCCVTASISLLHKLGGVSYNLNLTG